MEAHPYLFSGSKKPRQSCRKRRRCPGRQIPGGKSAHDSGCETWSAEEKYSWWGWRRFFLVTLTRMKILVRLMATRRAQIMVSAPQERLKQIRASAFGTLWKSKPISTWKLWKGDFKLYWWFCTHIFSERLGFHHYPFPDFVLLVPWVTNQTCRQTENVMKETRSWVFWVTKFFFVTGIEEK